MGQLVAVMLTLIPEVVPTIFDICVIVGLIGGFLSDKVAVTASRIVEKMIEFQGRLSSSAR